jgi:hypothetical protein
MTFLLRWSITYDSSLLKLSLTTGPPNGGVDAAASNCATDKLSITSPLNPLASNDLFERPQIVTRYWFPVNRKRQARRWLCQNPER